MVLKCPIHEHTHTHIQSNNNNRIIIIFFRAKRPEIQANQLKLADNLEIEMPASIME